MQSRAVLAASVVSRKMDVQLFFLRYDDKARFSKQRLRTFQKNILLRKVS